RREIARSLWSSRSAGCGWPGRRRLTPVIENERNWRRKSVAPPARVLSSRPDTKRPAAGESPQLLATYLLINHVPFARRSESGRYEVGDLWLQDLRAQAKAIADAGMRLLVATPCVERLDPALGGSFSSSAIRIHEEQFDYIPLP